MYILQTATCTCIFYRLPRVHVYFTDCHVYMYILQTATCTCIFYRLPRVHVYFTDCHVYMYILQTATCTCIFYRLPRVHVYFTDCHVYMYILQTATCTCIFYRLPRVHVYFTDCHVYMYVYFTDHQWNNYVEQLIIMDGNRQLLRRTCFVLVTTFFLVVSNPSEWLSNLLKKTTQFWSFQISLFLLREMLPWYSNYLLSFDCWGTHTINHLYFYCVLLPISFSSYMHFFVQGTMTTNAATKLNHVG